MNLDAVLALHQIERIVKLLKDDALFALEDKDFQRALDDLQAAEALEIVYLSGQ